MTTPTPRAPKRRMPKFKHLQPMAPDDPFYQRGYRVGVPVFGSKPAESDPQQEEHNRWLRGLSGEDMTQLAKNAAALLRSKTGGR